jgi:hypothetical protein
MAFKYASSQAPTRGRLNQNGYEVAASKQHSAEPETCPKGFFLSPVGTKELPLDNIWAQSCLWHLPKPAQRASFATGGKEKAASGQHSAPEACLWAAFGPRDLHKGLLLSPVETKKLPLDRIRVPRAEGFPL